MAENFPDYREMKIGQDYYLKETLKVLQSDTGFYFTLHPGTLLQFIDQSGDNLFFSTMGITVQVSKLEAPIELFEEVEEGALDVVKAPQNSERMQQSAPGEWGPAQVRVMDSKQRQRAMDGIMDAYNAGKIDDKAYELQMRQLKARFIGWMKSADGGMKEHIQDDIKKFDELLSDFNHDAVTVEELKSKDEVELKEQQIP